MTRSQIELWSLQRQRQTTTYRLRSLYETLAGQLFDQYEPCRLPSPRVARAFLDRVNQWLSCFPDDNSRWAAFRSIQYIFFAGQSEFDEMYRHASENILKPWLIDTAKIDIFSANADIALRNELKACWPCPGTDSFRINGFLHITRLKGKKIRPDWKSLSELGGIDKIRRFVANNDIKYLILLEDFVGSGGQMLDVLKFAVEAFKGPILVVPLIICATGDRLLSAYAKASAKGRVSYRPVTVIADECLVTPEPSPGEPKLFPELRSALSAGYQKIKKKVNGGEFGYELTGSLVVLYSNCPNNTPPIFHLQHGSWKPLFPRSSRS